MSGYGFKDSGDKQLRLGGDGGVWTYSKKAAEVEHFQEIGDYLNSAAAVLSADLNEQERPLSIGETMNRETGRAGVHRFESSPDAPGASTDAA